MAGNMTRAEAATFIPHETSPIPEALISSKILSLKARLLWVPECSPAYGVQEWELIDHPTTQVIVIETVKAEEGPEKELKQGRRRDQ